MDNRQLLPPNLYIVGPPRSGTTSLARWLALHDAIWIGHPKEPGYHSTDLEMPRRIVDTDTYLDTYGRPTTHAYAGEATPWYMFSKQAASSIHTMNPGATIIIMLRNPVDRLASLHNHHVFVGLEREHDLETAVFQSKGPSGDDFRTNLDYLDVARLAPQAKRFYDLFGPEQIVLVDFDALASSPRDTHLEILEHLEVEPFELPRYPHLNKARHRRSEFARRAKRKLPPSISRRKIIAGTIRRLNVAEGRPDPSPALRDRIIRNLDEDTAILEELIGRDLDHWRTVDR